MSWNDTYQTFQLCIYFNFRTRLFWISDHVTCPAYYHRFDYSRMKIVSWCYKENFYRDLQKVSEPWPDNVFPYYTIIITLLIISVALRVFFVWIGVELILYLNSEKVFQKMKEWTNEEELLFGATEIDLKTETATWSVWSIFILSSRVSDHNSAILDWYYVSIEHNTSNVWFRTPPLELCT